MIEKQNNWERIEAVVKWANMSTNYFARYIGLARGENLYQIKRGNNGISRDVAARIVERFPQISKLWLLTGEGDMFASEALRGVEIPCYNRDVERDLLNIGDLEPDWELVVPPVGDCDLAMTYTGRAMGDRIPAGTLLFLKAVERESIIPGEEYVIVSRKIVTLRMIRTTERPDQIRLVAVDSERYDDIMLNVNEISSLYKVKGKLILNN